MYPIALALDKQLRPYYWHIGDITSRAYPELHGAFSGGVHDEWTGGVVVVGLGEDAADVWAVLELC